jgi:hypothetical protein
MTAPFAPGMRMTEERLNVGQMIGRCVAILRRQAAQTIASTTTSPGAALSWDDVGLDVLSGFSGGAPTRWTPTVAGLYRFDGAIAYASTTAGTRRGGAWSLNGATTSISSRTVYGMATTVPSVATSVTMRPFVVQLNGSSDYVELLAWQSSGGNLDTVSTDSYQPTMIATYVGPP